MNEATINKLILHARFCILILHSQN